MVERAPRAELLPFASALWASEKGEPRAERERVVPTGDVHLVVRLGHPNLRIYRDERDAVGETIRGPIVGGPRSAAHLRDVSVSTASVGMMLRPGKAHALFGVSAKELSGAHWSLSELWRHRAQQLLEALHELRTLEAQAKRFEEFVLDVLSRREIASPDPRVVFAAGNLGRGMTVGEIASHLELSPRRLHALFIEDVGLSPKRYARIKRVQTALSESHRARSRSWSQIAFAAGFSDQAHLTREMRAIAGVTPRSFRRLAPEHAHHLPLLDGAK